MGWCEVGLDTHFLQGNLQGNRNEIVSERICVTCFFINYLYYEGGN